MTMNSKRYATVNEAYHLLDELDDISVEDTAAYAKLLPELAIVAHAMENVITGHASSECVNLHSVLENWLEELENLVAA